MKYWCHFFSITADGGFCGAREACVEHDVFMQYCTTDNRIECPHYVSEETFLQAKEDEENQKVLKLNMAYDIRC